MKSSAFLRLALLFTITLAVLVTVSETRGGRRGGGSIGGIFGWRIYKKTSSGGSRRVISGSPMQMAAQTKSNPNSGTAAKTNNRHTKEKHHQQHHHDAHLEQHSKHNQNQHQQYQKFGGYPKQEQHASASGIYSGASYHPPGGSHFNGAGVVSGGSYIPPGGTYYPNTAALPSNAVYYAQPPIRSSSGTDFLFGMMTGHVLRDGLYGHHHQEHNSHVYRQASTAAGPATPTTINNDEQRNTTGNGDFGPTETDVPLAPFNFTLTSSELLQPTNSQSPEASAELSSSEPAPDPPAEAPLIPQPGGIICVPLLFNETDPYDPAEMVQVQKTVCYPAPLPPAPNEHCVTTVVSEPDPSEPTQMIQVQRQFCAPLVMSATMNTEPPLVAGDIGTSHEQRQTDDMPTEKLTSADAT